MEIRRTGSDSAVRKPSQSIDKDLVTINVGGVCFKTHRSTLKKHGPNYFDRKKLDWPDSTLFIDRDPEVFVHVLNYLRGYPNVPESLDPRLRSMFDADLEFYELKH